VTDVTIVLLNWNSRPLVFEAAASAVRQTGVTAELIIVDNGSTDGSLEELKSRFPEARYLEIGFNSGFTGGMNAGTEAARGEFVLWQNADLVLADDFCARGVALMRAHTDVGVAGGMVYLLQDGERTSRLDACGYTLSATHRTLLLPGSEERDVVGVSGSCPLFRRAALQSMRRGVGYVLDPWYFTYWEDVDAMVRLNLAGWRARFMPAMQAWHLRSGSTAPRSRFHQKPDATQVHHFKNRLATIIKTLPARVLRQRMAVLVLTEVFLPFYLLALRPRSVLNWAVGWRVVWKERRRLLADRAIIQQSATPAAVLRLSQLLGRLKPAPRGAS